MAYIPKQIQGSSVGGFTQGSVPFAGADGTLTEDNSNLFFDDSNNRLGIGTASPQEELHVIGNLRGQTATASGSVLNGLGSRGSVASPTATQSGDSLNTFQGLGHNGTTFMAGASIGLLANGVFSGTNNAGRIRFNVVKATTQTNAIVLDITHDNTTTVLDFSNSNGQNIKTDTTTGLKILTATSQKLGFFNATPVVQPTDVGALTDNSGGTASGTIAAISNALAGVSCGAVGCNANHNTAAALNTELGTIRNAIADLAAKHNAWRNRFSAAVAGALGLTA